MFLAPNPCYFRGEAKVYLTDFLVDSQILDLSCQLLQSLNSASDTCVLPTNHASKGTGTGTRSIQQTLSANTLLQLGAKLVDRVQVNGVGFLLSLSLSWSLFQFEQQVKTEAN